MNTEKMVLTILDQHGAATVDLIDSRVARQILQLATDLETSPADVARAWIECMATQHTSWVADPAHPSWTPTGHEDFEPGSKGTPEERAQWFRDREKRRIDGRKNL